MSAPQRPRIEGDLKGKVVLVTGAAGGIGAATAVAFARHGARLALTDLDGDAPDAQRLLSDLDRLGADSLFLSADLSDPGQCGRMVHDAADHYGRLDIAFNNAGINGRTESPLISTYPDQMWDCVISVNLSAVFHCLKAEIARMEVAGGGAIVNTASIASFVDCLANPAYTASKHGIVGLTKHVASNYASRGIRCNAVAPGIIETPMTARTRADTTIARAHLDANPQGRFGQAWEVAEAVVWLSSEAAGFVNGHVLTVDGGFLSR
jgi:NAD(P)-dependent dehydrogenase (short-subunit alcohol dehydrogenase family)